MKTVTLFDRDEAMCQAWLEVMPTWVSVLQMDVAELPRQDYLATAGNSYGVMTGGIDKAIRDLLGIKVQDTIQNHILMDGPIPVGNCLVVELNDDMPHKNLIYIPTMDRPRQADPIDIVLGVFWAMRAVQEDKSIAFPGLGTGTGGLSHTLAAKAMAAGIRLSMELKL